MTTALATLDAMAPAVRQYRTIDALECAILREAQLDIPVTHRFAEGLYAREITIPAGALVTGKIHKTRHLNIVSAGWIAVYTEREGWREIRAPFSFVAEPGTRRVGFALEDTVWTTVHASQETDLERLEAELIEPHDATMMVIPPYIPDGGIRPDVEEMACLG